MTEQPKPASMNEQASIVPVTEDNDALIQQLIADLKAIGMNGAAVKRPEENSTVANGDTFIDKPNASGPAPDDDPASSTLPDEPEQVAADDVVPMVPVRAITALQPLTRRSITSASCSRKPCAISSPPNLAPRAGQSAPVDV